MRVVYVGPGLAGVRTTVSWLGKHAQPPFEPLRTREGPWSMLMNLPTHPSASLTVRSDVRSNHWFPNAIASAAEGPRFAAHVDYLRVVDGIVFVADSQPDRIPASLERIEMLEHDLPALGRDIGQIPVVFQCNKQDLPEALSISEMQQSLRWPRSAHMRSIARTGEGILEALDALLSLMK